MKSIAIITDDKINELAACLDNDCKHIHDTISQLNELRELIIRRDDAALGKMLEIVLAKSEDYRKNELNRQSIREELAKELECPVEQITLSTLEENVSETARTKLTETKSKLKSLIEELRKEHLSTALLLNECARINNMLLKSIFNMGKTDVVSYDSKGTTRKQTDMAFVNLQF